MPRKARFPRTLRRGDRVRHKETGTLGTVEYSGPACGIRHGWQLTVFWDTALTGPAIYFTGRGLSVVRPV